MERMNQESTKKKKERMREKARENEGGDFKKNVMSSSLSLTLPFDYL